MLAIGCTGGIGAGKSTVTALLRAKGAVVYDADELARAALAVDSPGFHAVLDRFGPSILATDGSLDRRRVAEIVFVDEDARRDLEAIVHPVVEQGLLDGLTEHAGSDAIVVLDVALLIERDGRSRYGLDGVLVVDAPEDICLERLVTGRQMDESDARARIDAQMDRFQRIAAADFVILNIGTMNELVVWTGEAWSWMGRLKVELGR